MSAQGLLFGFGHGGRAGLGDLLGLKAFVNHKTEDKGEPLGQTGPHLIQGQDAGCQQRKKKPPQLIPKC